MVIIQEALPQLKRFLQPLHLSLRRSSLLVRCLIACIMHVGRMGAARPMFASFTAKPDRTPYKHAPSRIDVNAVNAKTAYGAERSSNGWVDRK